MAEAYTVWGIPILSLSDKIDALLTCLHEGAMEDVRGHWCDLFHYLAPGYCYGGLSLAELDARYNNARSWTLLTNPGRQRVMIGLKHCLTEGLDEEAFKFLFDIHAYSTSSCPAETVKRYGRRPTPIID